LQSEYGAAGQLHIRDEQHEFVAEVSLPFATTEEPSNE